MRWVSNTFDPRRPGPETKTDREGRIKWLKGKYIGEPKATEEYTMVALKDMDMVGVYIAEDGDLPTLPTCEEFMNSSDTVFKQILDRTPFEFSLKENHQLNEETNNG